MSHVDEGQLHAWLDGEFSATGGDEAAFEAHLENCALCLGRLERARDEREEADRILAFVTPVGVEIPPFEEITGPGGSGSKAGGASRVGGAGRTTRTRMALGWAATILLALGGGWMARGAVMAPGSGDGPGGAMGRESQVALAEAGADPGSDAGAADAQAPGAAQASRAAEASGAGAVSGSAANPPPPVADAASVRALSDAVPPASAAPQPVELPTELARARERPAAAAPRAGAPPPDSVPPIVTGATLDAREIILAPRVTAVAEEARTGSVLFRRAPVLGADAAPDVAARMTPSGVRIENNRAERLIYLVLDADFAARARWVPCASPDCEGVEPGDATEVSRAGIPGWQGSSAVLVFWWHLVPTPEGGVAPDSIRSIPVPYTPG